MKITWALYEEDGLDAEDPLGSIEITEGEKDGIRQAATYIDSWRFLPAWRNRGRREHEVP